MTGIAALTGATGFVGRHVLDALLGAGWSVRALLRPGRRVEPHPRLVTVAGDLEDEGALGSMLSGANLVVHCAGLTKASRSGDYFAVNAAGTRRLAAVAAAQQTPPRFVLLSSLAAREPGLSPYAASKHQAELEVRPYAARMPILTLRPPAIYGPGDRDILLFFKQFNRGFALVPKVAGARFSLLFVLDLAAAIAALAASSWPETEPLDIHDGQPGGYDWATVTAAAGKALDRKVTPYFVPQPVMLGLAGFAGAWAAVTGTVPAVSADKVRELFHPDWACTGNPVADFTDWRPRIDLGRGLQRTATWYRNEGWL